MKQYYVFAIAGALLLSLFCAQLFAQSGWSTLNSGTTQNLNAVHFIDVNNGYVAGVGGTVLKTTDGGANWQNVSPPNVFADINDVHAFDATPGSAVVVGNGGLILLTIDGGSTWNPVSSGISDDLLSVSFVFDAGICGGASQTILYSTSAGATWNISQTGFFGGGFWGAHLLSPQIGFVGGQNSIFQPMVGKTTDGGVNWNFTPFYLNGNEGQINSISFTDEFTGYAASFVWTGEGAISRTSDGGTNWSTIIFPNILYAVNFPPSGASQVGYCAGAGGAILKTYDAGSSWQSQNSGVTATLRDVYFLDFDNGYAVGEGGVILKTTTGGEPPTGFGGEVTTPQIPQSLVLYQNYPNPFNPSTTIRYYLPQNSFLRLTIYNAAGQEVKVLVNGSQPTGHQSVTWDGKDNLGREAGSGVYVYRLKAGENEVSRKMLLVR